MRWGFKYELVSITIFLPRYDFRFDLTMPKDGQWGIRLSNGSWTGLVGLMESKVSQPFTFTTDFLLHKPVISIATSGQQYPHCLILVMVILAYTCKPADFPFKHKTDSQR